MKSPNAETSNLIDRTIALWQARRTHDLSREEARRNINGVTGFFAVLTEWSRAETLTPMRCKDERADPVRTVHTASRPSTSRSRMGRTG